MAEEEESRGNKEDAIGEEATRRLSQQRLREKGFQQGRVSSEPSTSKLLKGVRVGIA